jgi:hypothetical protein
MRRVWLKGLGDVFKSSKDERYLFSKQLTLNSFNFLIANSSIGGRIGAKVAEDVRVCWGFIFKKNGGDISYPLHIDQEARPLRASVRFALPT